MSDVGGVGSRQHSAVNKARRDAGFKESDVAERYAGDAAFHNGFDALCWAKEDLLKTGGNPSS